MLNGLLIIIAYIIGSTPSALIIGKLFYKGIDVRTLGSGNLGTTNMLRSLGIRAAIATAAFDVFIKGSFVTLLAVILYNYSLTTIFPLFIGMISAIGHAYPVFARFSGGKAVATSIGILLTLDFKLFLLAVLILVVILLVSKIMAIASFLALAIPYALIAIINDFTFIQVLTVIIYYIFILYLHRENIKRIINHEEKHIDVIDIIKSRLNK